MDNKAILKHNIVTISRYWNNPEIYTMVTSADMSLSLSLTDFLTALKLELGSVTWTFTKDSFHKQFDLAAKKTIERIKEESVKAV